MPIKTDYLILGKIHRPHGIRGEVRMSLLTDFPERLLDMETVFLGKSPTDKKLRMVELEDVRFHKRYALLSLSGVESRDAAERLKGQMVMIDLASAVPLEEDEYYLYQLIDLMVQTEAGKQIGRIKDVMETGANDVYIVKNDVHGELLLPAHEETILKIDIEAGIVLMTLPEGLLPD